MWIINTVKQINDVHRTDKGEGIGMKLFTDAKVSEARTLGEQVAKIYAEQDFFYVEAFEAARNEFPEVSPELIVLALVSADRTKDKVLEVVAQAA